MNHEEIQFWEKQRDEGTLITAIRTGQERATNFFGAATVSSENEAELYRIIEAYRIINSSDEELLTGINRVPSLLIADLENISPPEHGRKVLSRISKFTLRDVTSMKKEAQEYLKRVIP